MSKKTSLCLTCANAYADLCRWIGFGEEIFDECERKIYNSRKLKNGSIINDELVCVTKCKYYQYDYNQTRGRRERLREKDRI